MKTVAKDKARSVGVATRIAPELKRKLQALAKDVDRSEAYIVAEAIAEYVEMNAWQIQEIRRRLDDAKDGAPAVPHEEVVAWVESWGADRELPMPEPRK